MAYNVVLPAGYGLGRRYPVLWLLHGYSGGRDDWLRRTDLLREIERYPFIMVLPDVGNSWYANAPSDPTTAYEDFVTIDLYNAVMQPVASSMGQNDSVLWSGTGQSIIKALGTRGAGATSEYDPLRIVRRTQADSLPYIFLAIGTRDDYPSFLPSNRAFTDSLRAYGARYEYHELPGRHSWIFWESELGPMLKSAWSVLNADMPQDRTQPR